MLTTLLRYIIFSCVDIQVYQQTVHYSIIIIIDNSVNYVCIDELH